MLVLDDEDLGVGVLVGVLNQLIVDVVDLVVLGDDTHRVERGERGLDVLDLLGEGPGLVGEAQAGVVHVALVYFKIRRLPVVKIRAKGDSLKSTTFWPLKASSITGVTSAWTSFSLMSGFGRVPVAPK